MDTLKFVVTTAAVGIAALLAGGQQASAQVRIGSVLSVTGPASFLGDPEKVEVPIRLARPRDPLSVEFLEYQKGLLRHLGQEPAAGT